MGVVFVFVLWFVVLDGFSFILYVFLFDLVVLKVRCLVVRFFVVFNVLDCYLVVWFLDCFVFWYRCFLMSVVVWCLVLLKMLVCLYGLVLDRDFVLVV